MPFRHGISYCEKALTKASSGIDLDTHFVGLNAINHKVESKASLKFLSLHSSLHVADVRGWRALDYYYVPTTRPDITLVPTEVIVLGVSAPPPPAALCF